MEGENINIVIMGGLIFVGVGLINDGEDLWGFYYWVLSDWWCKIV